MKSKEIYESITVIALSVIVLSIVVAVETAVIYFSSGFRPDVYDLIIVSVVSFCVLAISVYVARSLWNIKYVLRSKISECNSDIISNIKTTKSEFIDTYHEIKSFVDTARENMRKEFDDLIAKYSKYSWLVDAFEDKSCWFESDGDEKIFIVDVPWYGRDNCHKRIKFYRDENDDNKYQLHLIDISKLISI